MTKFHPDGDIPFQLDELLNEGLTFTDNHEAAFLETDLDEGENEIRHGLGFIPLGYLVIYKEKEGNVYGARKDEWSEEILFLRSSVPNQTVRLFVL